MTTATIRKSLVKPLEDWIIALLFSLGACALAMLGGVARLLNDKPESTDKITRRDWWRYITTSLLAGALFAIVAMKTYGLDPLLLFFAGAAGFQSIQVLGFTVAIMRGIGKRVFGIDIEQEDDPDE